MGGKKGRFQKDGFAGEERKGVKMGKSSIERVMAIMMLHAYTIDKQGCYLCIV